MNIQEMYEVLNKIFYMHFMYFIYKRQWKQIQSVNKVIPFSYIGKKLTIKVQIAPWPIKDLNS